ncbi:protein kinase domain-containing protein [Promicromonospora sp. CA-289599]|uniref:serine/threonine-protein kinase n=1 Tax=Promicromonospora sp. CA-289599 TaxID=3240014 RepID=UPI003D92B1AD
MTSPAPGVGEVAPAAVGPGPVPLPDPELPAVAAPTSVLDPEPAPAPATDQASAAEPPPPPPADPDPALDEAPAPDPAPASDQAPPSDQAPEPDEPQVPAPPADFVPVLAPEPAPDVAPVRRTPLAGALPVRPVRRIPASGERMGRFTLAEALGHGGFAHVYRAVADDDSEVALKVLTGLHDDARDRFAQEAHLLERLDGRGFPRFVESGLDADQPWFAMELVPGTTLRDRVREEGPLSGSEALSLAKQLVDALLVLQEQRALHRDLKPANIMVDGDRAVLIDLGIAKVFDAATSTQPAGTVSYMAPELFGRRVHPRSDVYSLGLLLLYASTGTLPLDLNFLGRDLVATDLVDEEPAAVVPGEEPLPAPPVIDRHVRSLVLAMTRYQPDHRPPLENIARVVRARLASATPDPTLMLTSQVLSAGVTAGEAAALPATDVLTGRGHTKPFQPGPLRPGVDRSDAATPSSRVTEPWHALVYDRALMSVLAEVHADGFDGAAEQVVADHVAEIGAHVADGRTPAEIKDWIWQAMRWRSASPPDGHADTLRGWRAFRSPEPVREVEQAPAGGRRGSAPPAVPPGSAAPSPVAATQVVRKAALAPKPQSFEPRKSPVKHLGPAPKQPPVKQVAHATRPMPVMQPPARQQPATRPPSMQPGARPAAQQGVRPGVQPGVQQGARPAVQQGVRPGAQQRVQPAGQQAAKQRPPAPVAAPQRKKRPWPLRLLGTLVRWVPRLLLLGAVYLLVTQDPQAGDPFLAAPAFAIAALGLAALLRIVGQPMRIWFYVVSVLLVGAGSAVLWAISSDLLYLGA